MMKHSTISSVTWNKDVAQGFCDLMVKILMSSVMPLDSELEDIWHHKSLPSKENGNGFPIVILLKSEWSGLNRKLSSSGTITLGTRRMGCLPAFNHASPDNWQATGGGSSLQFGGTDFRAMDVTREAGKLIGKIT